MMPAARPATGGRLAYAITISADTLNYVLNTAKVTGYSAGLTDVTVTINSGIYVGSSTTAGIGFDVNTSWAAGDTVTIINNGFIVGAGGNGADGPNRTYNSVGINGAAGGPALRTQRATIINNASGTIGGGGGGGGSGGGPFSGGGGGGGRGYNGGAGGAAGIYFNGLTYCAVGTAGSKTAAGSGGFNGNGSGLPDGFYGGSGGGLGAAGAAGQETTWNGKTGYTPGAGGAAGNCTTSGSNALITWTSTGTRLGTIA